MGKDGSSLVASSDEDESEGITEMDFKNVTPTTTMTSRDVMMTRSASTTGSGDEVERITNAVDDICNITPGSGHIGEIGEIGENGGNIGENGGNIGGEIGEIGGNIGGNIGNIGEIGESIMSCCEPAALTVCLPNCVEPECQANVSHGDELCRLVDDCGGASSLSSVSTGVGFAVGGDDTTKANKDTLPLFGGQPNGDPCTSLRKTSGMLRNCSVAN